MKLPSLPSGIKGRPKPVLGLDIGSHTIKLVEFVPKGSTLSIRRVGRALLPPDAIMDGSIKEPELVSETLQGLLNNTQPRLRRTATSIAGYSVIVKKVLVPYAEEREIEDNLMVEAENYVPFEIDEVYIDFFILKPKQELDSGTEIFLVAAKKEVVDEYADLIQGVGLVPAVVDVDAFSMGNALEGAYGQLAEPVAMVDIGAQKTNMNIVLDGVSSFARDMAIGGGQLTEAIQEATGLDYEEAEKVKIAGSEDRALMKEVGRACEELCRLWADELKKALDFYKNNSKPDAHPAYLFLSGGTALLNGLDTLFSNELGISVRVFNPWRQIEADSSIDGNYLASIAPQMTIATGLALRTVEK